MHNTSAVRIFGFSALATVAALCGVLIGKGAGGMLIAAVLIAVEVAFSFDNAILNAKILSKLSTFWQTLFLTAGALVAVFGMRVVFPIVVVALTTSTGWHEVLNLALHHPAQYADKLELAHPALSAFGGAFLLVLALDFFIDDTQQVMWLLSIEQPLRKIAKNWVPPLVAAAAVLVVGLLPANHHHKTVIMAGLLGIVVYSIVHGTVELLGRFEKRQLRINKTALKRSVAAAIISLIYLEVLDATFSFDSVLGAFAVTGDVVLIAIGLGVGALWVRSLTVFMVRRGTLAQYKYIEHGAHYTILALAIILFVGLFTEVPEVITGLAGIGIIISSIIASRQAIARPRS